MDHVLLPAPSPVGDAPAVQLLADLREAVAPAGTLEYLPDYRRGHWVHLQGGTFLHPVADLDAGVAEGCLGPQEETTGSGLPHSPRHFLPKILAVIFVHRLDDALQQPASGVVLGLLGDGDDADALAPQLGLERHGVLTFPGESAEFPDKNHLEGGLGFAALVDHLAELGPIGDPAALGLVHVLAGHGVAVALGVVPERPELSGHGEVHVLAVAGDPGVESRRGEGLYLFSHPVLLWYEMFWSESLAVDDVILCDGVLFLTRTPTVVSALNI